MSLNHPKRSTPTQNQLDVETSNPSPQPKIIFQNRVSSGHSTGGDYIEAYDGTERDWKR